MKQGTRVTVYKTDSWEDLSVDGAESYVEYTGLFWDYNKDKEERFWAVILKDSGKLMAEEIKYVKFHMDSVSEPKKEELIPEGTDVIVYPGSEVEYHARFLRFIYGDNDNKDYEQAMILKNNGDIKKYDLKYVRFLLPENNKEVKNKDSISKRLNAI